MLSLDNESFRLLWRNSILGSIRPSASEKSANGFNTFLKLLHSHDKVSNFFHHYRYMNLEHVARGNFSPSDAGKFTVEFRNFRPPRNPQTAKAFADLLIAVMEKQAVPGRREKFEWITEEQYNRFNTGSKIESDWRDVRNEINLKNVNLDLAVTEYVEAIHQRHTELGALPGSELFAAYSQKEKKGSFFELRLPVSIYAEEPVVLIEGHFLEFEKIQAGHSQFWIASVDTKSLNINPSDLRAQRTSFRISTQSFRCESGFEAHGQ